MKYTKIILLLLLLLFFCTSTYAKQFPRALPVPMTTDEIIELSQAGVSDEVIISQIKATRSIFYLNNEEIIELKQAGVTDPVIDFMIKTTTDIPHAIPVERPVRVRYYYYSDPWYDYWWGDPWYDHWWWRHRGWRHRRYGTSIIYEEIH